MLVRFVKYFSSKKKMKFPYLIVKALEILASKLDGSPHQSKYLYAFEKVRKL
jgi:hypothetical protein